MAEPYRYVGWLLRNDASARARDKGGRTFVRQGKTSVLIIAELFLKAVVVYQPVTCGQATVITGGIRLSDWYYKYIREIKHMRSNT
ncbi:hypothetical protein ACVV4J_11545 [Escherichia coli]